MRLGVRDGHARIRERVLPRATPKPVAKWCCDPVTPLRNEGGSPRAREDGSLFPLDDAIDLHGGCNRVDDLLSLRTVVYSNSTDDSPHRCRR
jgi:hypothetical protein